MFSSVAPATCVESLTLGNGVTPMTPVQVSPPGNVHQTGLVPPATPPPPLAWGASPIKGTHGKTQTSKPTFSNHHEPRNFTSHRMPERHVSRPKPSFQEFLSEELNMLHSRLVLEYEARVEQGTFVRRAVDDDPLGDPFEHTSLHTNVHGVTSNESVHISSHPVALDVVLPAASSEGPDQVEDGAVQNDAKGAIPAVIRFTVRPQWIQEESRHPAIVKSGTTNHTIVNGGDIAVHEDSLTLTLHPEGPVRVGWDSMCGFLVVFECFSTPLQVFGIPDTLFVRVVLWIMRLFWTLDMLVSSITGFTLSNGQTELKPRRVFEHYFKTWFAIDFTLVAVDWIEAIMSSNVGMAKVGRTMRLFRLGRVLRLIRVQRSAFVVLENSTNREYLELAEIAAALARIVLFLIWLNHLLACFWYGVSDISGTSGQESWTTATGINQASFVNRYFTSLHFALAIFAGADVDVRPYNTQERAFTVIMLLFTFVVASLVVSTLTTTMTHLEIAAAQDCKAMVNLRQFLADNKISHVLTERVMRNAKHAITEEKKFKPNIEILRLIAEPLRVELHFEVYFPALQVHSFFRSYGDLCPEVIRRICHEAIRRLFMTSGDVLFNIGEVPTVPSMLFFGDGLFLYDRSRRASLIGRSSPLGSQPSPLKSSSWQNESGVSAAPRGNEGSTEIDDAGEAIVETAQGLKEGQWACEAVLWTDKWVHCGSLFVDTESTLLAVDAEHLQQVMSRTWNPTSSNVFMYASKFVDGLNKTSPSELSDLCKSRQEVNRMVLETCPSPALAIMKRKKNASFDLS